ncbi:hypothetical protein KPH14_006607 [Odynerus spinipes]|uniref:Pentatricopeptide repeat-containing protein 2 n=1 Tax=Odynerus spinipes TaxID=1348599 RepID=A0AAD9VRJ5_9HYME|nr:hypothetical protein KPH14_006607 [Odynerus spinipes]
MLVGLRLLRFNCPLMFNSVLRNTLLKGTVCLGINRFIFSDNSLGLNGYKATRVQMHQQFANVENSFREKMKEIINSENSIVFTEDLKAMLHLVNKNSEDVNLIINMMHKFNNQNKELRFGTYIFGPVIMRAFYYLDEPDIALNAFLDSKLTYFFDQNITYTILMTLLYKHEKYSDIRKVYDIVKTRNIDIQRFPRNPLISVIAGCYKENSPESLQYALENWRELTNRGLRPIRRVITYIAALAINQNSPEVALEILTGLRTSRYIDNRCLKVYAYAKLNRLIDVITILRQSTETRDVNKECYFSDTIEFVEKAAENADDGIKEELIKIITIMRAEGLVDTNTLTAHLDQPIERHDAKPRERFTTFHNYNNHDQPRRRSLGLKELL